YDTDNPVCVPARRRSHPKTIRNRRTNKPSDDRAKGGRTRSRCRNETQSRGGPARVNVASRRLAAVTVWRRGQLSTNDLSQAGKKEVRPASACCSRCPTGR